MALYDYLDLSPLRVKQLLANGGAPTNAPVTNDGFFSAGNGITITPDGAYEAGGWVSPTSPTSSQQVGGMLSTIGKVGSIAGVATNNRDLANAAGNIGLIGRAIAAPTPTDVAQVVGSTVGSRLGISAPVISTINGAIDGFQREGTKEGAAWGAARGTAASLPGLALGAINPVLGLIGSLAFAGPAAAVVDNMRTGYEVDPTAPAFSPFSSTVSQHQMGRAINNDPDPMAAFINALSPAKERDLNETETGVNATTPGATSYAVTSGTAVGTPLGQLSSTSSSFETWNDFGYGGWSDPTAGVEGSTAATADSPDGPDGMNAGQGFDINAGGDSGGGGWDGGYGGVDSGGYDGPGAGGWY